MKKIFALAVLFMIVLSACGSPAPAPTAVPPVVAPTMTPQPPTPTQEPPTPTLVPTITSTPSPTPIPAFHTEEFNAETADWTSFYVDGKKNAVAKEPIEKTNAAAMDGSFKFDIEKSYVYIYSTYNAFDYDDVRIDVSVANEGVNTNVVALVCRYSPDGWYEFNINSDGTYFIGFGKVKEGGAVSYGLIKDGGSNNIKQGQVVNEYAAVCKGDTLSLYINGELAKEAKDTKFNLKSGKIGIGASTFAKVPVKVNFDWVKITQP
jgi:hypothetical protein